MPANVRPNCQAIPAAGCSPTDQIRDVSGTYAQVIAAAGADGEAGFAAGEEATKQPLSACEAQGRYRCNIAEFHGGIEYRSIRQLALRDVRLVYAPAEAIGKFRGASDNWRWPRHTGDFAFLRAYVDADGTPATVDPANVRYRSASFQEVNPEGVDADELVMVMGYPKRTKRGRTASRFA